MPPTQALDLFTEADYEEIGRSFLALTQTQVEVSDLDFAAAKGKGKGSSKPKQCQKGYSCGQSCVSKTKSCKNPLEGQAKDYAGWLSLQVKAGAKLSKSQQKDADELGLAKKAKTTKSTKSTKKSDKKITPEAEVEKDAAISPIPSMNVDWSKALYTPDEVKTQVAKIEELGDPVDIVVSKNNWQAKFDSKTWRDQNNAPPPPPPTAEEISAIRAYTGGSYVQLNHALRNGFSTKKKQEALIESSKLIASGLKQLPSYDKPTYRGTVLTPELLAKYQVGATVTSNAFESSAKTASKAWAGNTQFVMIPKKSGSAAKDIEKFALIPSEQEALWPPGVNFKVLEVKQSYMAPSYIVLQEID